MQMQRKMEVHLQCTVQRCKPAGQQMGNCYGRDQGSGQPKQPAAS